MYLEYAIWRYFTGDRSLSNQYFEEANLYCTSTITQMPENNIQLQSELGGNYYIAIPNEDLIIQLQSLNVDLIPAILMEFDNNNNNNFANLELSMGNNIVYIDMAASW